MAYEIPTITDDPAEDAEVIELRPGDGQDPPGPPEPPAALTDPGAPGERRPVIPGALRRGNVKATAQRAVAVQAHRTAYHGIRLPWYLAKVHWFAVLGGASLTLRLFTHITWTEGWLLESAAVADGGRDGHQRAMQAHTQGAKTRAKRWQATGLVAAAVAVAVLVLVVYAPWWLWPLLGVAAVVVLAQFGKPHGKAITSTATVPSALERLTDEIVFRALGSIGIPAITKAIEDGRGMQLVDPIHQDGPGYLANVDLPYGVTAGMVMDKREELASGLRRTLGCVWPETVPGEHTGRLALWVGYKDMNRTDFGLWPLARRGTADLFKPALIARDQRGRPIEVTLMFVSVIIGAIPRMGKTFLMRLLLLIAALDVRAEIHAYDNKGTGDLACMERVAYRYGVGDDEEDIEYAIADFRALREELRRRTKVIRRIAKEHPEQCPENKVTPQLASRKDLGLHPIVVGGDECQVWFEHPKYGDEFETICTDLVKRGPAVGIIAILATQKPDAKSIPTGISANAVMRMCLKVMSQPSNDQVLGQSMHKNGVKATMFAFEDKGIFYLAGEGAKPRIARAFYIDGPAADKIALRARALRQDAGTLRGYCVGEDEDMRSFLADVLAVFSGDAKLWCSTIAGRLRDQFPGVYADITPAAVASQLRDKGVTVKNVREAGQNPNSGCERADVEAAAGAVTAGV